jgi:hypothetical protein
MHAALAPTVQAADGRRVGWIARAGSVLLLIGVFAGCDGWTGPASTDTSSDSLPSLEQRVEFLQRYVTYRRGYRDLGFHIVYHNNGSLPPGPSEWDIELVATVPPAELAAWVPAGVAAKPSVDTQWLADVPGAERAAGIREWYTRSGVVVGIDRKRSVVAYRNWAS